MRDIIPPLGGQGASIYVLKSSDRTSEIALYKKFYEYYGHEVTVYEASEVEANIDKWSHDAVVLSALNQQDLLSFRMETLQAMIDAHMLNDFRTIFLTHDKRFLSLIFVDEFTHQCLTEEETTFLRQHAIPTYLAPQPPKGGVSECAATPPLGGWGACASACAWQDALLHKDNYILKPYNLGKSVGLYAGVMTDEETWKKVLGQALLPPKGEVSEGAATPPSGGGGLLQPFIRQRTYPCVWEGKHYDEYVCGMMLLFRQRYVPHQQCSCDQQGGRPQDVRHP